MSIYLPIAEMNVNILLIVLLGMMVGGLTGLFGVGGGVLMTPLLIFLGIPPTVGFMGKLYIFSAAINSGLTWLVICGVLNSVVSAYYYLRVIRTMYMIEPESNSSIQIGIPPRLAIGIVAIGIVVLGIIPSTVMGAAEKAVLVFF